MVYVACANLALTRMQNTRCWSPPGASAWERSLLELEKPSGMFRPGGKAQAHESRTPARQPHPHLNSGPPIRYQRPSSRGFQPSPGHPILPGFQDPPPPSPLARLVSIQCVPGSPLPLWGQGEAQGAWAPTGQIGPVPPHRLLEAVCVCKHTHTVCSNFYKLSHTQNPCTISNTLTRKWMILETR